MSIWTELLFLHGHIATPMALAQITQAGARVAAPAAAHPPITSAPATPATGEPYCHPLRAVGQLP